MKPNLTWNTWAAWLGKEPKPGTIYKDVVDMRAARRVWEGFQAIVGVAPEDARKYGTFPLLGKRQLCPLPRTRYPTPGRGGR